jgi:hypothetical protein
MTNRTDKDEMNIRPDYRHAYPVLAMLIALVTVGLTVRYLLVPETFGEYGYYRAAAMDDEKAIQPRHVGRAACLECHDDIAAIHAKDVHSSVECETCHGIGDKHVKDSSSPMSPADTREDCLVCHRQMDSRPGSFPQVDLEKHYKFVGVKDPSIACVKCHSGHEPLYLSKDLHSARLHPLIQQCNSCHIGRTDETLKKPDMHPKIFQCDYCHADLAKSFAKGSHAKVSCTACHLFIKDNAFSGRIVRNTNPKFCLLCHQKSAFKETAGKDNAAPPVIDWPAHITDVSADTPDPKRPCVECHQDQIHALYTKEAHHAM